MRFYLLQLDAIPPNYKIVDDLQGQNFYLHLWVFKDKKELSLDCSQDNKLCESIFSTIPHELTHGATSNLFAHENTRWFAEGLAEYVSSEVIREFRPLVMRTKFKENVPKVALHRPEIRDRILLWNNYTNDNDSFSARNEWFQYKAAEQLIRLIVEQTDLKDAENALKHLFTELVMFRQTNGKPAESEQLLTIIQHKLKINPKSLGRLNENAQKELGADALKILSQKNLENADKNYSLIILASLDEMTLPVDWLIFLFETAYREKGYAQNLAATALSRRIKQTEFDIAAEKFFSRNKDLRKTSLKKIKKDLQKLSIRPPVE